MAETIDWPPPRRPRRRGRLFILAVLAVVVLGGGTALSYYVDALWFGSLGYSDVFWRTLNIQAAYSPRSPSLTFLDSVRLVSRAETGAPRRIRRRRSSSTDSR